MTAADPTPLSDVDRHRSIVSELRQWKNNHANEVRKKVDAADLAERWKAEPIRCRPCARDHVRAMAGVS